MLESDISDDFTKDSRPHAKIPIARFAALCLESLL